MSLVFLGLTDILFTSAQQNLLHMAVFTMVGLSVLIAVVCIFAGIYF
jgi:hypothetical protein